MSHSFLLEPARLILVLQPLQPNTVSCDTLNCLIFSCPLGPGPLKSLWLASESPSRPAWLWGSGPGLTAAAGATRRPGAAYQWLRPVFRVGIRHWAMPAARDTETRTVVVTVPVVRAVTTARAGLRALFQLPYSGNTVTASARTTCQ